MIRRFNILFVMCWLVVSALPAHAETCCAAISDIYFGAVNVRAGGVNQTSGTIQITCTGALVSAVGVCVRFGPGNGGAGSNNSPCDMRRADGSILQYELRSTGNGDAFGTLNQKYALVPILVGGGLVTVPFYADIVSTGISVGTGSYSSVFNGTADIELSYGILNCNLLGTTASILSFEVSAEVVASCELDVGALSFGSISSAVTQPVDADTTINVRCTDTTPYVITLDMGNGSGVSEPAYRKLTNDPHTLSYGLFMDSVRVQAWGKFGWRHRCRFEPGFFCLWAHSRRSNRIFGIYQDSILVTVTY